MDYSQYENYLKEKSQIGGNFGFEPTFIPSMAFPFQCSLIKWAVKKGRGAVFADCGLGKGQPYGSKLLTPNGWVANTDIKIGDKIISSDGHSYPITGIFYKPVQSTYRFYFSDGSSFVVDGDHLHIVRTNNDRQRNKPWRVMSTRDLLFCNNLRYGLMRKSRNYDIPVVKPIKYNTLYSGIISPYIMGVLLGDGSMFHSINISSGDAEIIDRVRSELPRGVSLIKASGKYDYRIKTGIRGNQFHPFRKEFIRMGIMNKYSHEKFIPDEYKRVDDRIELLRGLMDTDGYTSKDGSCQYYSTSEQLAMDAMDLIRSLGGIPTFSSKHTHYTKNGIRVDCKDIFMVTFSLNTMNPFYLSRKANRWNSTPRDNGRWIDRIEYEKDQPTICISVDSPDHSYVTENYIVTHNTIIELSYAQNIVEHTNSNVLYLTPLAVGPQIIKESEKFGIEATRSRDGKVKGKITITNYEQLEKFNPNDFSGLVCDESSILKNYDAKTKEAITIFARKLKYRLLATATAAPNDFIELGTSSEALGYLGYMDMLSKFFINDQNNCATNRRGRFNEATKWRLKGHAHEHFWQWVAGWARAIRFPSDLGFSDDGYELPQLIENDILLRDLESKPDGYLFSIPANGLKEERDEHRNTIKDRCEKAAEIALSDDDYCVVWCNLNDEGDLLEKLIPGCVQVSGKDSDESKEEKLVAFSAGQVKKLVIKPKIGAWGLNWQHCNHTITFPTHSYEQHYQSIRRFWRFGQKRPVTDDMIYTEGDINMIANLKRKKAQADEMFTKLVRYMHDGMIVNNDKHFDVKTEVPNWL